MKKKLTKLTREGKISQESIQKEKFDFYEELGKKFLKNFNESETLNLIENYIFEAIHKYIFLISDDEEMKNK